MGGEAQSEAGQVWKRPLEGEGIDRLRLFVAIELPPELRTRLKELGRSLSRELPPARWVDGEKIHLTLVFLGGTAAPALADLRAALASAFGESMRFRLRVVGAGAFPNRRSARVVWVGLDGGEELLALQREVERRACAAVGQTPERRRFRPHLTLARCRRPWPAAAVERFVAGAALEAEFAVDHGTLFESRLGAGGSRYRVIDCFPLGSAQ